MKKVKFNIEVNKVEEGKYNASLEVFNEEGEKLTNFRRSYECRHEMYPAYKVFQSGLAIAKKEKANLIDIQTNLNQFAYEISGIPTVNTTLYTQTMEQLEDIKVDLVEAV